MEIQMGYVVESYLDQCPNIFSWDLDFLLGFRMPPPLRALWGYLGVRALFNRAPLPQAKG